MALRASYFGVKRNLKDELKQLDGAVIIKDVGQGLTLSATKTLAASTATKTRYGVVQITDTLSESSEKIPNAGTMFTEMAKKFNAVVVLGAEDDLDTIADGAYYWSSPAPINSPESRTNVGLISLSNGDSDKKQIAIARTGNIYIRTKATNWSNWYKFTGTEVVPST